jgi:type IV pilus assembly protein PilX
MNMKQRQLSGKKQSGAVLVLGLTLIMVLSVIVISSARTTVLQQKMSANLRDKELAFQSAESALNAGETYIRSTRQEEIAGNFSNANGLFIFDQNRVLDNEMAWENLGAIEAQTLHQVIEKPVYVIEELPEIEVEGNTLSIPRPITNQHFRITSKSKGGTKSSLSVLQSMYKK